MEITPAVVIAGIGLIVAIFGYIHSRFVYQAGLEGRIARLEAGMGPWQKALEQMAIQILHHPFETERDELLEKMAEDNLSPEEAVRLRAMLDRVIQEGKARPGETAAALILSASLIARYKIQ